MSWMIAVIIGIAVVSFSPILLPVWLLALLFITSVALAWVWPTLWPVVFVIAGVIWASVYGYHLTGGIITSEQEGRKYWLEGKIIGLPTSNISRGSVVQSFDFILNRQVPQALSSVNVVRLKWQHIENLKPGQQWRLQVKLKRPYGMHNPGGFDYQSWLIQQGIGAVGYVRDNSANTLLADNPYGIDRLRWRLANHLDNILSHSSHLALFKALLIGDKRAISQQQWALFANTGTTHLMVISGLHIGLIAGLVYCISRQLIVVLFFRLKAERWAAFFALASAAIYAMAAGFSLPTQRALVMIAIVMAATISHRQFIPLQGLVTAALFCLLLNPLAPTTLSFWLSFAAVAWIMYGTIGRFGSVNNQGRSQLIRWSLAQYCVFIGLLPVLAIVLGQISLLSPLANMLLLPLFSVVLVPLNLLAALLLPLSEPLSLIIWQGLDLLVTAMLAYLQWLTQNAGGALLSIPAQPLMVKCLASVGALIILLPRGVPLRWAGLLLLLPLIFYRYPPLEHGDVRLTIIDVGQGLSVLVETKQKNVLYDVGASYSSGFDVASAAVLPLLKHRAISKLDGLILSHNDNDHAGGFSTILENVPVSWVLAGELTSANRVGKPKQALVKQCYRGQHWHWQGVDFEILHPGKSEQWSRANDRSCVLKITAQGAVFLLTGDIEKPAESHLLSLTKQPLAARVINPEGATTEQEPSARVLIAAHHGSLSSSSWPFVKTVKPDYVVFSSGYRNPFNHPQPSVVSRFHSVGSNTLTTNTTGAITFDVKAGVLQPPVLHRQKIKHYWLP